MRRISIFLTAAATVFISLKVSAKDSLIPESDSAAVMVLPGHFLLDGDYETCSLAKRTGLVTWDVSLYGSGATHGMPFWAGANRRGLVPENLSTGKNRNITGYGSNRGGMAGFMTAGAGMAYMTRPEIVISAGLSVAGYGVADSWKGMIDRLYFGLSWKKLHLDIGMKDRSQDYNGLSLTGGDLAYSGNARNFPGYNLSTDFIYLPWTKKIIGFIAMAAIALVMAACGGDNSPKGVAEQAVKCIQDKDYEGYVDLMRITEKEGQDVAETKQGIADLLRSKAESTLDKKGGIKSYEVLSETVADDGNSAVVQIKVTYGNGEEKTDDMKMVKSDGGKWLIDSGK